MAIDNARGEPLPRAGEDDSLRLARVAFPELAARLDDALERHGSETRSAVRGRNALDQELDDRVKELRSNRLAEVRFASLDAVRARRIHALFDLTQSLFDLIGARVPEPEHFQAAGVDLGRIADLTEWDDLQVIIAPHGLGARTWEGLASMARAGGSNTDTDTNTDAARLMLSNEVLREFVTLDSPPESPTPTVTLTGAGVAWTIRGIPNGARPEVTGVSFLHGPHPTVAEMLTLQLMRSREGKRPVDASTFTWLAGAIGGGRLAARHVYDEAADAIRVSARDIGHQGPHLGVRPPVE